jgi:hypothetical protein
MEFGHHVAVFFINGKEGFFRGLGHVSLSETGAIAYMHFPHFTFAKSSIDDRSFYVISSGELT